MIVAETITCHCKVTNNKKDARYKIYKSGA